MFWRYYQSHVIAKESSVRNRVSSLCSNSGNENFASINLRNHTRRLVLFNYRWFRTTKGSISAKSRQYRQLNKNAIDEYLGSNWKQTRSFLRSIVIQVSRFNNPTQPIRYFTFFELHWNHLHRTYGDRYCLQRRQQLSVKKNTRVHRRIHSVWRPVSHLYRRLGFTKTREMDSRTGGLNNIICLPTKRGGGCYRHCFRSARTRYRRDSTS